MQIIKKPSPNFGSRDGNPIKYICLHIMAGSLAGSDSWFANSKSQVSSHYGVGYNGEIHQYVEETNMAFANGVVKNPSAQIVKDNLKVNQNKISLSIECEGYDLAKAPQAQLDALVALIQSLATKYSLPMDRNHIIGHYQIDLVDRPNCPAVNKNILDIIVKKVVELNNQKIMKKLEIQKLVIVGNASVIFAIEYAEDGSVDETFAWSEDRVVTQEELLDYAKSKLDPMIADTFEVTLAI